MIKVGIIIVSDKCSEGNREDKSTEVIKKTLPVQEFKVKECKIVPDEKEIIKKALIEFCDSKKLDLVLTSGGTGFAERDVTPEATQEIIEKNAPGISEAMRIINFYKVKNAILSRGISGIRKKTLIINLPGSPRAVEESLEVILPVIPHAIKILKGTFTEH